MIIKHNIIKPTYSYPSSDYIPSLAQSSTSTHSSSTTKRAYRTFKRKFPNHPLPSKPGTGRNHLNHPDHTNTPEILQISLPLFPQYTISHSNPHTEQPHYVDEHILIPKLHWTSFYCFSNPVRIPVINTPQEVEKSKNDLFRLKTALTPRQFTHVGCKKLLKISTAPRANDYSIEYYNHNIIRPRRRLDRKPATNRNFFHPNTLHLYTKLNG